MTAWLLLTDPDRAREFVAEGAVSMSNGRSPLLRMPVPGDRIYLYLCRSDARQGPALNVISHGGMFIDNGTYLVRSRTGVSLARRGVKFDPAFQPVFHADQRLACAGTDRWKSVWLWGFTSLSDEDSHFLSSLKGMTHDIETHDLCIF